MDWYDWIVVAVLIGVCAYAGFDSFRSCWKRSHDRKVRQRDD